MSQLFIRDLKRSDAVDKRKPSLKDFLEINMNIWQVMKIS